MPDDENLLQSSLMTDGKPNLLVRVADAAAVASVVIGLFVVVFGGFVVLLGPVALRVHAAGRVFFIALALSGDPSRRASRRAAAPAPPARPARHARGGEDSTASIVRSALFTRVAVLVVGYFAVVTIGVGGQVVVGFQLSGDPVESLPGRWDAGWYGGIAMDGYSFQGRFDRQQNIAFFPAFPMLMRVVGYPLGAFVPGTPMERRMARLLWGGVFVSFFAFAWAAVYLWRLARDTIGQDRATSAVALLAAYPFAVFYSAPYTESLFLLGAVAAIYHFRRAELMKAAAWGLLVGLTRPNGCLLSVVLALLIFEKLRFSEITKSLNHTITKSLLAAAAPGVGMLIYSAYVKHLTGAWFGWARLHETWGRSYSGLAPLERAYGWITDEGLLHVVEERAL